MKGERSHWTEPTSRMSLRALRAGSQETDGEETGPRPATYADCSEGGFNEARPCPYVACKYNNYLDVRPNGNITFNFGNPSEIEPDMVPPKLSCALDVANRGGTTLLQIGRVLQVSRERVRQLENLAMGHARSHHYRTEHGDFVPRKAG